MMTEDDIVLEMKLHNWRFLRNVFAILIIIGFLVWVQIEFKIITRILL